MLVNVAMLTLNTLALTLLVELFHLWYVAATVLIAAMNVPISFLAHRTLSYRIASGSQPGTAQPPVKHLNSRST
jgi:putative flippase GtrA